ncbi:hypothetical protein [Plantactinospora endophytica]|uniref:Uncharacterized protein n=1 Tax=Plantactinospora endophytica TaxID=673535 RepID=A0ABQ4EBH2_9ACTN|nr:hypothetical protein [Plantactinospora endophytica]GIG92053.1 hypothetical protein Pen02_69890 [Plantactinospora endophytica]
MSTSSVQPAGSAAPQPGSAAVRRSEPAGTVLVASPARSPATDHRAAVPVLDYYLIHPPRRDEPEPSRPAGLLVEEFGLGADRSAVRLDSAGWTPGVLRWHGASALSRELRVDAHLRDRVVGVSRQEAAVVYHQLAGAVLPDEETLRGYFDGGTVLPTSAPLWLDTARVTAGFAQTRTYRILFAAGPDPDSLAKLLNNAGMTVVPDLADPQARVVAVARRRVGGDAFTWKLRRIGAGAAWGLDVTADLVGGGDAAVAPMLRELTTAARLAGLIPVTIERFC